MADPTRYSGSADKTTGNTGSGFDHVSNAGAPCWVKVVVIVAVCAALLFIILQVAGGGDHGPNRHAGGVGGRAPVAQSS